MLGRQPVGPKIGPSRRSRRVLIYRLGSIGDTLVALPALKLIRRSLPGAEFALLTARAGAPETGVPALLRGSGLADTVIEYDVGERHPAALLALRRQIRDFAPDLLVYLAEQRGLAAAWRDWLFFRLCGIPQIVGVPLTPDLVRHRCEAETGLCEAEAARLARTLAPLGDARLDAPESWDPDLLPDEEEEAERRFAGWQGTADFIAACIGVRSPVRDWGEANWTALFTRLAARTPSLGLMLLGGAADRERSDRLAALWPGPVLVSVQPNPRVHMAMLRRARMFVGVDSGPMHMAAAVGVPTVAIFAGNNLPGIWFPGNGRHSVLYHPTPCAGCALSRCVEQRGACLAGIGVDRVLEACTATLASAPPHRSKP